MRRLLTLAATFAALTLLTPQLGQAQSFESQLGIYSDQVGTPTAANYVATPNMAFYAYLVLTDPVNDNFNGATGTARPITQIDGYECKVVMPEGHGFFNLGITYPGDALNLATPPDYVVGFASSVPVVGGAVVLCSWNLMVTDSEQYDITMNLTRFPSLAGAMSVLDAEDTDDPLVPVYVSTNDFAVPVFSINGDAAIAVDNASWGDVKALFR